MGKVKKYPTFREIAPDLPDTIRSVIVGDWLADVQHRVAEVGVYGSFVSPYSKVTPDSDVDVLLVIEDWDGEYEQSIGMLVIEDWKMKLASRSFLMGGNLGVASGISQTADSERDISPELKDALRNCVDENGIEVAGERRVVDFTVASPEQADRRNRDGSVMPYAPIWRSNEVDADV